MTQSIAALPIKGVAPLDNPFWIEGFPDDRLMLGTPAIKCKLCGKLEASVQFPCSNPRGERKHYTDPTEINGLSVHGHRRERDDLFMAKI